MSSNSTSFECPISRIICPESTAVGNFTFDIFNSIREVNIAAWQSVLPADNLFYSREYLLPLEEHVSDNMVFRYAIVRKNGEPVGLTSFNIIEFNGSNIVMDDVDSNATWFQKTSKAVMRAVVNRFSMRLLVNGNTFTTGEYGVYFKEGAVSEQEKAQVLDECIEAVIAMEAPKQKISGVLIKDFYEQSREVYQPFSKCGYLEFPVQPNMILKVDPAWETLNDYLGAMTSKYRTRTKKALKRAASVDVREMSAEEIKREMPTIHKLYDQVIDPSSFKLTKLGIDYFVQMKETLQSRFHFLGFYDEKNELIAFISMYQDGDELVAGFTGLEYEYRDKYDLYLNILYKIVEKGIELKVGKIVFGRTAMEIKSGVGAVPHNMFLYAKHRSSIINRLIKPTIKILSRTPEWTQRKPFKVRNEVQASIEA